MSPDGLTIGIDAANLRDGGGITHLVEILQSGKPDQHGISKIIVFGGTKILDALQERPWLFKVYIPSLDKGLGHRLLWQKTKLVLTAKGHACDLLFAPGGSFFGSFCPVVTMSRNMLPFDLEEIRRYGWSSRRLRLLLLRYIQSKSLRKAQGVIFLTEYAMHAVQNVTGRLKSSISLIPHGLNNRFRQNPKPQKSISQYNSTNPFRLIYVSSIDQYKHQWCVISAVAALRAEGFPLRLDLIGPAHHRPSLKQLSLSLMRHDPHQEWAHYHGPMPHEALHKMYAMADVGVFASSCENMPNILLEKMAAGLPIASANKGPSPEILGEMAFYFDPLSPEQIASALKTLLLSPEMRAANADQNFRLASKYSWANCSDKTLSFLAQIALKYRITS